MSCGCMLPKGERIMVKVICVSCLICSSLLGAMLISGCAVKAPDCSDSNVIALVDEVIKGKVKDGILSSLLSDQNQMQKLLTVPDFANKDAMQMLTLSALGGKVSYKEIDKYNKYDVVKDLLAEVDKRMRIVSVTYENYRVEQKDDAAKKTTCLADMNLKVAEHVDSSKIKYTAQHTEDGKIYVEILDN